MGKMTPEEARDKAIKSLSVTKLAQHLGITRQAIYMWPRVPPEHCGIVCEMAEWVVQPYDLQPKAFEFLASRKWKGSK